MSIGGFKQNNDWPQEFDSEELPINSEINITPLTDVFLVLLIIFMVTSSVISQMGVQVNLPKSNHAATASKSPGIIVTVTKKSEILINGVAVSEEQMLENLNKMLQKTEDKSVILEGDQEAVLGSVVKIMDIAKKAGAIKFSVATKSGN